MYGQIKNERKLRLSHGRSDARVYCHEALQLHEKLNAVKESVQEDLYDSDDSDFDQYM